MRGGVVSARPLINTEARWARAFDQYGGVLVAPTRHPQRNIAGVALAVVALAATALTVVQGEACAQGGR
jgi:hypothetical protein